MSKFQHSLDQTIGYTLARNAISANELSKPIIIWDLFSNSQNIDELVYEVPPRLVGGWKKRTFDLMLVSLLLIALAPILLTIAIWIKLTSDGPAFFMQERSGAGAKTFEIYKFRTMVVDKTSSAVKQATRDDPRLTSIGGFLRKMSLDELPQLFNVLKGEMSLVGPRPHALCHDKVFAAYNATYKRRFLARPGITGLAQVSGARGRILDVDDLAQRVSLDLRYIETWTLRGDISIIARTVKMMFRDDHAF